MSLTAGEPPRLRHPRLARERMRLLTAAARRVPLASLAQQARALALWDGQKVVPGDEGQLALVLDLGVLDPLGGHGRGIDRQIKAEPPEPGSETAALLTALAAARFALYRMRGPHPEGGAEAEALADGTRAWIMDPYLAALPAGSCFGARLAWLDDFALTCGIVVPADASLVGRLLRGDPPARAPVIPSRPPAGEDPGIAALLEETAARPRLAAITGKPGFAAVAYRTALDLGLLGPVPGRTPQT